jgi:hypothetical protein
MGNIAPVLQSQLIEEVQILLELREYDNLDEGNLTRMWERVEKHAADFASSLS